MFPFMPASAVRIRDLRKTFGAVEAVAGVDLDIGDGEFFSMLGPSGSGKTTVLRLIAGFERPTAGTIELGGADVTGLAPFDRDVNTVFQDYALFPHLDVLRNVEYGLKVRRVPKARRRERALEALRSVRLGGMESRRPAELSGGQRQRVALARALVNEPKVLLLDEPLGALDLKLREEMQVELKSIQRRAGITFVFVTHDQEEALTLSDRVAVLDRGRIQQVGTLPRSTSALPPSSWRASSGRPTASATSASGRRRSTSASRTAGRSRRTGRARGPGGVRHRRRGRLRGRRDPVRHRPGVGGPGHGAPAEPAHLLHGRDGPPRRARPRRLA